MSGRGISHLRYRQGVLRDIEWLLNAKSRIAQEGFADYPETEASVLNFGMPDPTGSSTGNAAIAQIEKNIATALLRFEPRIIADSLVVKSIEGIYSGAIFLTERPGLFDYWRIVGVADE